ncbi:MAG: gluconolaconase [Acidobacteria bacterium]|nr:gluconolaconase [Acidobacteriota bacterium]
MPEPPSDDSPGRREAPGRLLLLIPIVVVIVAGVAGFVVWRWILQPQDPLEADWVAVAAVLAGDGTAGMRDGDAARARFSDPFGVAASEDGTIYVADAGDAQRVRRITPNGVVSTLAGGDEGYADGSGAAAQFSSPSGLAIARDGTVYVADTGNNAIRRITRDGVVSTAAGDRAAGHRDGTGHKARFNGPVGIAVNTAGQVIVADTYNDRIRVIQQDGTVVTVAGSGQPGSMDGESSEARFHTPCGAAVDAVGNIYVADTGNGAVRMISPAGVVSTIGPMPEDGLLRPTGIAVSGAGLVYVTDDRGRIVEIAPGVSVRTLAGSRPGFADGSGLDARFRNLAGLALASPGRLVVTDPRNALVRLVAARSRLDLQRPVSPRLNPGFDAEAFAWQPLLWPIDPIDGPVEVTGTLGEARGGDGAERFHAGVDVHAPEGTPVRAIRGGVVTNPVATAEFGTLNESVRIGPVTYVHLRVGRERRNELLDPMRFVPTYDEMGRMVSIRVKRGARFTTGEAIGTVNAFNHVHLNIGWPGEEHNPLRFRLVQFEDTLPPTIARGGIRLLGEDGQPIGARKKGRLVVGGRVQVIVDAWDRVNGNKPRRRLGLYQLGYQVLNRDGSPAPGFEAPRETIRFDRLAPEPAAPRVVYASGSGIPFFGRRVTRFLYVVTNTLREGIASAGTWDTSTLPPGDYTLRILAADIRGNQAVTNRDVAVTILPAVLPLASQ